MYLEGVIVCVNYSDFLSHTLPACKNQFNKLVVVTDTKDKLTKKLCEFHNVQCVMTDVFYENGDTFNKGKAINEGLKHLSCNDWVIQMDADIYLPPLTRMILNNIALDNQTIYGIDRMMCPSYIEWLKFIENPGYIQEAYIYIHPTAFPMGVRIAEYMNKGYEPIGYFQLWNPKLSKVLKYPEQHGKADRTDVLHAKAFPRIKRQLLPELLCIHLDSEGDNVENMGRNWRGRKSKIFNIDNNINIIDKVFNKKGYELSWWYILWTWIKNLFK